MLAQTTFYIIVVMFAICNGEFYSRNIYIKPGESAVIESVNYPKNVPANLRQTWALKTEPGAIIRLFCSDIRLLQNSPCMDDAFVVSDGDKVDVICGARFNYVYESVQHHLAAALKTGAKGFGLMQCKVRAFMRDEAPPPETTTEALYGYIDVESEEIDSSEHGGPRGHKNTTCNCGWTNKKVGRVFGGKESQVNEFPFMSGLLRTGYNKTFCGSSLITPYHAITAAHCLFNVSQYGPFSIVVGEHDQEKEDESSVTEYIQIKKYILHKDYKPVININDIAFLILERRVRFSQWVGPICLPTGPINLENKYIKVIGWGRTPTQPRGSPVLQKVNLRVLSKSICARLYRTSIPAGSPNQLCTFGKRKSACTGDSGGPLIWLDPETNRYTLIGLNSFGGQNCGTPIPRVSTDVTTYVDWIYEQIRENGPETNACSKDIIELRG